MSAPTGADLDALRAKAQQGHRDLRGRIDRLSDDAIDLILREARSHYAWTDKPVPDAMLEEIYDIVSNGATSMNTCPARIVFVKSAEGKERLAKTMKPMNVPKMMGAPVTAIIAHDLNFYNDLPFLFPHEDRRKLFEGKDAFIADTAYRNGTLQGAYLMIAARALGLDVGAMSGFSNADVDEGFFAGTSLKDVFMGALPFALVMLIVLFILIEFPILSLALI